MKLEPMTHLMPQVCSGFLKNNFYCYSGIIAWIFNEANETVFIRLISLKYFVNSRKWTKLIISKKYTVYLRLEVEHISSNQVHAYYLYSPIGVRGAL